jgi:HK97 family phage prohead protease
VDHLGAALELKSVDISQRIISGYAAVCSNLDRTNDIIDPGAFTKCLTEKAPGEVAVFIGHQTDTLPVGIPVLLKADGKGLYSETLIKPGPVGDDLLETAAFLQRHGRSLGLSIGYRTRDSKLERVGGRMVRRLLDVDVMEYSFAASQSIANPEALVVGVKAAKQASEYHIEQQADGWHVIDDDDGDDLGTFDSETEAQTAIDALVTEEDEPADDEMPMRRMGKGTDKTLPLLERPMTKTDYDALNHDEKVALYWSLVDEGMVAV